MKTRKKQTETGDGFQFILIIDQEISTIPAKKMTLQ